MKKIFFSLLFICGVTFAEEKINILTYNLGLAHGFVPYAKERTQPVIEAIKKANYDLLCMQEIWLESDRDLLIEGLKQEYPYVHYIPVEAARATKAPTCSWDSFLAKGKFGRCMMGTCLGKKGDDMTNCVLGPCGEALTTLIKEDRECAMALMAQVGKNPILGILSLFNPFRPAETFTYGGSAGLLVMSKKKFLDSGVVDMSSISTLSRRVALYSEFNWKNKKLHFYCTHLTANLDNRMKYSGSLGSWEAEHGKQIDTMLAHSEQFRGQGDAIVLAGDFNCSFSNAEKGIAAQFENSCLKIPASGYLSAPGDYSCSFCRENPTNMDLIPDMLIDHVFVLNAQSKNWKIEFNKKEPINTQDGKKDVCLSDHYGVGIQITD